MRMTMAAVIESRVTETRAQAEATQVADVEIFRDMAAAEQTWRTIEGPGAVLTMLDGAPGGGGQGGGYGGGGGRSSGGGSDWSGGSSGYGGGDYDDGPSFGGAGGGGRSSGSGGRGSPNFDNDLDDEVPF